MTLQRMMTEKSRHFFRKK